MNAQTIDQIIQRLREASDAYYNSENPIMTDDEYDELRDELIRRAPNIPFLSEIGAAPKEKTVRLPFILASLNKIKPGTGAVSSFVAKGTKKIWILSEKLDGISALWYGGKLYLRGDGLNGVDVSAFAPHIQGLVPSSNAVRGELIVPRGILPEGTLARSWVNGQLHQKIPQADELKKIHFVAYEILDRALEPLQQFEVLKVAGFEIPWRIGGSKDLITDEKLMEYLKARRATSQYDTDGIVVAENIFEMNPSSVKNPSRKVAFKMLLSDQCAETTIVEVQWNPSAQGYLIPRLQITPVVIGTARIEYVTAHNARFVVDNKLGPGARIVIRRSGDVIPAVERVVAACAEPKMPTEHPWKWLGDDKSAAHIVLDSTQVPKETQVARLVLFAKTLELSGLGPGIATKLVEAGLQTPGAVFRSTEARLAEVIGKANGAKLSKQLAEVPAKVTESQLMVASSVLPRGVGDTKLKVLFEQQPDPRKWSGLPVSSGWSKDSFAELLAKLPAYQTWRSEQFPSIPYPILPAAAPVAAAPTKGTVCFTGVRSKELETTLEAAGWKVVDSVIAKLNVLVVPDGYVASTGKVKKAQDIGTVRILGISSVKSSLGLL